jgi:hypothetical protein
VGLEGGVMGLARGLFAVAVASSLLLSGTAWTEAATGKHPSKITVHPKSRYGFLPGYRQPPALTDWRAQNRISAMRAETEWRFYGWDGEPRYGFGYPGYYRGRYNGGSFGPCWTSTPIGMMPTCGQ